MYKRPVIYGTVNNIENMNKDIYLFMCETIESIRSIHNDVHYI